MTDEPRDPRLQAALRHAPDAELAPPPGLDRQILGAARQAVAAPPWWRRRWQMLLQPQGAAAFATLVLGTSVVLLWRGVVPPEALPGSPPQEVATAPSADATRPPVVVAQVPATPAPPAAKAPPAAPPHSPRAADTRQRAEPPPQVATAERRAAVAPAPAPLPAVDIAPAPPPAAPVGVSPPPAAAPVLAETAPPPPPAPAAPAAAAQRADAGAALGQAQAPLRPMPAPAAAPARKAAEAMASRAVAPAGPHAEPPIAELSRFLRGPWLRREAREMPRLQTLLRDAQGATLGALAFDDSGVWWRPWIDGQPAPWAQRAALDAADANTLRQRYPVQMKPPE